jgi:sporulation integral membrane protein YtvI
VALILFLGTSVVGRIIKEAKGLAESAPNLIKTANDISNRLSSVFADTLDLIPEDFQVSVSGAVVSMISSFTTSFASMLRIASLSFVSSVPNILMVILISLISCFFLINDKDSLNKKITEVLPGWFISNYARVKKGIIDALGGYIRAQLIIMSVVGAICVLSLTIMRFPYSLLVGIIIAIIDAMPILGSGFILWPWTIIALIYGEYKTAIWLIATYGLIFLTRQLLEPRVLGKQIGVHPILTLMSIYVGLKIFGGFGFILGPFTLIMIKTVLTSEAKIIS